MSEPEFTQAAPARSLSAQPRSLNDRLYTREEAADALNVTLRFITRCVQERRIRYVRVGRMVRIPESALVEYLSSQSVDARRS